MKSVKQKRSIVLFFSLLCTFFLLSATVPAAKKPAPTQPIGIPAQLSTLKLSLNGQEYDRYDMPGYVIDSASYYRLTDLAQILRGSYSQFDIIWNSVQMRTELRKHSPYHDSIPQKRLFHPELIYIQWASAPVEVENTVRELHGFLYQGEFYVALTEIMEIMNVKSRFLPESMTLKLISEIPENVYPFNQEEWKINSSITYDDRWASLKTDYMFYQDGYYFLIYPQHYKKAQDSGYEATPDIIIEKLSPDMKIIDTLRLPFRGQKFGGFYHGQKYNYFLFGNDNLEEKNNAVILTLIKTDQQFKTLAALDIKNTYTIEPFHSGAVSISEWNNTLVIHTARLRYKTPDGLNHQSQLTISIDTNEMKCLNANNLGPFQVNHVSHSFNQFALHDPQSGELFLIDHGDAHPRSIVMTKLDPVAKNVSKTKDVLKIPGKIGANQTGVFVGGVAQSKDNILIAVNHIDYDKAESFDDFNITGQNTDYRSVYLYLVTKRSPHRRKAPIKLTAYSAAQKLSYSAPKIIDIGEDQFFIIWQQRKKDAENHSQNEEKELQYTIVSGDGQIIKAATSLPWYELSNSDLIYHDGYVLWQVRNSDTPEKAENAAIFRVKVK